MDILEELKACTPAIDLYLSGVEEGKAQAAAEIERLTVALAQGIRSYSGPG